MKVFKSFISKYLSLSFKTKLSISFVTLIIISIIILAVGYYYKSSQVIYKNAGDNILGLVKKSNESLDARFAMLEESAVMMHLDEDLFEFFRTADLKNLKFCRDNDKKITKIMLKYFPFTQDIYSINIVTKEYAFGQNPNFLLPKTINFSDSRIYYSGLKANEKIKWIPTYNLLEEFYSQGKGNIEARNESQYVFTATRLINCSAIENNILYKLNDGAERPVLIINFQEALLKKTFKESTYVDGSYYYVLTDDGGVVSRSLSSQDISFKNSEWLKDSFKKESGAEYTLINGKKMLVCYDVMNSTGWITVVFTPYDKLLKTLPDMYSYTLFLTIFIIVISVVLASFISERITLPIKKLLAGIKKIGEGNFEVKIEEVGNGEMTYLIHGFNEMNEKILKLIEENYQVKLKEIEAELKALNFQFNPHFLYNTLNIINWISIQNNQTQISEMIVELSEMLEYTAKKGTNVVSFKEDMKYLKNYLSIMNNRFVGKFNVEYDIEPTLYNYNVPKFFLQPFIENILIHGFEEIETGGIIKIAGWIENDTRYFCIEDNGKGIDPERMKDIMKIEGNIGFGESIGIENVNMRIKLLFGKQYGVFIESEVHKGTKVIITLPLTGSSIYDV